MSGDKQHKVVVDPTFPCDLRKSEKINLGIYLCISDASKYLNLRYLLVHILYVRFVAVFATRLAHLFPVHCLVHEKLCFCGFHPLH